MEERLQKIIAAAGIASRRKAEELITSGRVAVNGKIVTQLGAKADAARDHVRVDGKLLHGPEQKIYLLLNKPKGFVTTVSDPEGRPTVMDLIRAPGKGGGVRRGGGAASARVYPVGRLDWASEGLLLMTNDGELAHRLMRAAHVQKTYLVKVSGQPPESAIQKLRQGVSLPDINGRRTRTAPAQIHCVREAANPWYEVTLTEGRNRQIRKMFEQVGHHVEKIKRVRYGPLRLDVPSGEYRQLTPPEVRALSTVSAGPVSFTQPSPSKVSS